MSANVYVSLLHVSWSYPNMVVRGFGAYSGRGRSLRKHFTKGSTRKDQPCTASSLRKVAVQILRQIILKFTPPRADTLAVPRSLPHNLRRYQERDGTPAPVYRPGERLGRPFEGQRLAEADVELVLRG